MAEIRLRDKIKSTILTVMKWKEDKIIKRSEHLRVVRKIQQQTNNIW